MKKIRFYSRRIAVLCITTVCLCSAVLAGTVADSVDIFRVFMASYSADGKLIETQIQTESAEERPSFSRFPENADHVKIFALDENLRPLWEPDTVKIGEQGSVKCIYEVIATPQYYFGDADESTGRLDCGYEAIQFRIVSGDSRYISTPDVFTVDFSLLGLEGKADDYILSHFEMDIIPGTGELLSAKPLMKKVSTSNVSLGTLSSNTQHSYYGEPGQGTAKRLSGEITFEGNTAYFYNAPESYIGTPLPEWLDDYQAYEFRNSENIEFIDIRLQRRNPSEHEIRVQNAFPAAYNGDDYFKSESEDLVAYLTQIYTGGYYSADFYDVNGDDRYDYMLYKPYSVAIANTDTDYDFWTDGIETSPEGTSVIYTNGADISGKPFENGDYILGYFDQRSNTIEVAEVLKKTVGTITDIDPWTGMITLDNQTTLSADTAWKYIGKDPYNDTTAYEMLLSEDFNVNYVMAESPLLYSSSLGQTCEFYTLENIVFAYGVPVVNPCENILFVTMDANGQSFGKGNFDPATGSRTHYAYAWVDGALKYVPLNVNADIYPKIYDYEYNAVTRPGRRLL